MLFSLYFLWYCLCFSLIFPYILFVFAYFCPSFTNFFLNIFFSNFVTVFWCNTLYFLWYCLCFFSCFLYIFFGIPFFALLLSLNKMSTLAMSAFEAILSTIAFSLNHVFTFSHTVSIVNLCICCVVLQRNKQ